MREVMPRRFQALIATMAKFSSEISTSEKWLRHAAVQRVAHAVNANLGQRFGEGQRGFLAGAEQRRLPPCRQMVQAQLALAGNFGLFSNAYPGRRYSRSAARRECRSGASAPDQWRFSPLPCSGRKARWRVQVWLCGGLRGCSLSFLFLCGIYHAIRQIYAVNDIVKKTQKTVK